MYCFTDQPTTGHRDLGAATTTSPTTCPTQAQAAQVTSTACCHLHHVHLPDDLHVFTAGDSCSNRTKLRKNRRHVSPPAGSQGDAAGLTSKAAQAFAILLHQTREQAEPELLPWGVSLMSRADGAALLEDTLDLWAHYGPQPPERVSRSRGADLLGLDHLATYGVPTNMTPKETTMNERLEDHAESAARFLVELVNALHRQGLQYPAEAYHIYSYVTRAAAELRNVLDLIEGSVREMNVKGAA